MAFRRKRYYKKKFNNRRFKRRQYRKRRLNPQRKFYFKRTFTQSFDLQDDTLTPISQETATPRYNDFRLDQLPDVTNFQVLFDEYKINGISRKYIFDKTSQTITDALTNQMPTLCTCKDYNTTIALAGEPNQYETVKYSRLDKVRTRYFKPAQQEGNMNNSRYKGWISLSATGITEPHVGLRECVLNNQNTSADNIGTLKVVTTFYIVCRTVQ